MADRKKTNMYCVHTEEQQVHQNKRKLDKKKVKRESQLLCRGAAFSALAYRKPPSLNWASDGSQSN